MNTLYPNFNEWMNLLKMAGVARKMWNHETILCPKSWKVYYDEGLSVLETLKADIKNQ